MNSVSQWFQSLRGRIFVMVGVPILALCLVAFEGLLGVHTLSADLEVAMKEDLPITMYRGEMDAAAHAVVLWLLYAYERSEDSESRKNALVHFRHEIERFEKSEHLYESLPLSEEEKQIYQPIHDHWPKMKKSAEEIADHLNKNDSLEDEKARLLIKGSLMTVLHPIDEAFEKLDDFQVEHMAKEQKHAEEDEFLVYLKTTLFFLVGLIVSIGMSTFLSSRLTKVLTELSGTLGQSSDVVASASNQMASSSEEMSQSVAEQAASLEQTAASLEEMNATVQKNSESSKRSADTSIHAQTKAVRGKDVVEEMIQSMSEIDRSNSDIMKQINQSNEQFTEIVKAIHEIGNKTKVINEIVFQTKLLSFNASVEAARAGELGKGFAVVAEEVGNLAAMSGSAAKEISDLIEESTQRVESIVAETKSKVEDLIVIGKSKVESGVLIAQSCGTTLNEIVDDIQSVSRMAGEISSASQEQALGVQEISKAMGQLEQMTQQNSAASVQAAGAAEQLSDQAHALKTAVNQLTAVIHGFEVELARETQRPRRVHTMRTSPLRKIREAS